MATAAPAAAPALVADFWDDACKHLMKRDRVMKKLIPRFGDGQRNRLKLLRLHRPTDTPDRFVRQRNLAVDDGFL